MTSRGGWRIRPIRRVSGMTNVSVALNALIGLAYLAIAGLIARGLLQTSQVRSNGLAVATAAIFLTSAGGHLLYAAHGEHLAAWDALTVLAALTFLAMRRQYA